MRRETIAAIAAGGLVTAAVGCAGDAVGAEQPGTVIAALVAGLIAMLIAAAILDAAGRD